ncbi:AMP-binding protein [Kitasatospora aburaviensis]
MWGAHFLAAALADLAGCRVIALGSVTREEYGDWLGFLADQRATAIGGTPSVLRLWFAHARAAGLKLPALRKVLWLGEAWQPQLAEDIAAVAPQARRWGMFGSTETWVVGTNTPTARRTPSTRCPNSWSTSARTACWTSPPSTPRCSTPSCATAPATRGVDQLPVRAAGTGDARTGPARQRRPGPRPRPARGRAGRPGRAGARRLRAQVVITEHGGRATGVDVLLLTHGSGGPGTAGEAAVDTARLRTELLSATFTLSTAFQHDPENFRVRAVEELVSNDRTGKTAGFVVRAADEEDA